MPHVKQRICIHCQGTRFEKVGPQTLKCVSCGLETSLRKRTYLRPHGKPPTDHKPYKPVDVVCTCGALLGRLVIPWTEERERLFKQWEKHYCQVQLRKEDLL